MDIGKLYDQSIASTYDRDENGLLSGARALATRQIQAHVAAGSVKSILDLAVGTGESLVELRALFPEAQLNGIDLSAEMIRLAEEKLEFNAIVDDVLNTAKHFAPESMDLALMHFLTTFVDGDDAVAKTSQMLKPGGYYSIVSSTFEAFPTIYALARAMLPEAFLRSANPAPENTDAIVSFCTHAGLEIVAVERFTKAVSFASFEELYRFGMTSGFFTHILCHLDEAQLAGFAAIEGVFPLTDQYCGSVVLARRPG